ncbi:MAG: hypothetical protein JWR78_1040, partial [Mycobacterium sp.]|nr:hypothetical protein [Mycobacterium sp.]
DVVTVGRADAASVVVQVMLDEMVEHVPVVDDGALVGICTRTDLLGIRRADLQHEQAQPGLRWRQRGLSR